MTIVLHYLNNSRATRVVWLLEELNVPYQTKVYFRDPVTFLAPPELSKVHPSGASPLVEDNGVVYAESGNILEHLITTYGSKSPLIWRDDKEKAAIKYALYAAEANLVTSGFLVGINHIAVTRAPWGLHTVLSTLLKKIDSFYGAPQFKKCLTNLENQIRDNGGWFCNGRITVADIMYEVTLEQFFTMGLLEDLEETYPVLYAWRQKILKEPGYVRAQEKQKELESKAPKANL